MQASLTRGTGTEGGPSGCERISENSAEQREGDDGFALRHHLVEQFGFEIERDLHFAGGNLRRICADKAELAMAEAFGAVVAGGANGRSEDAAGHGAPLVDIAAAGRGIESRTSCFVGKVVKAGPVGVGCTEEAGLRVAREFGAEIGEPGESAALDDGGEGGLRCAESGHSDAKAFGVQSVNSECAVTALRASDTTGEKISGAAARVGERCVDDLHELRIARREPH